MNAGAVLILTGLAAALLLAGPDAGLAQEQGARALPRIDAPLPKPDMPAVGSAGGGMVDSETITGAVMNEKDMLQYCVNISDDAREARYALLKKKLEETEADIDEKLVSLDGKLKAIKEYVEIRERFQAAAESQVVGIFGTMRPDAAAQQLAQLDTSLAAAIIMKLDPKVSSAILAEMRPKAAATLASILSMAMMPEEKGPEDKAEPGQ